MIEPIDINETNQNEIHKNNEKTFLDESFLSEDDSKSIYIFDETELNDKNKSEGDDILEDNFNFNNNNKQLNTPNNGAKKKKLFNINLTKSIGRRSTLYTSVQKAPHNKNSKDDLIDACWRGFFESLIDTLNHYTDEKTTFQKTNFKKQFSSNNLQNTEFLHLIFYKYLTFNPSDNEKYKKHKYFGSQNEIIIRKMIKNKNDKNDKIHKILILLSSTIEYLHEKYINQNDDEKIEIRNTKFEYFKTLSQSIKLKKEAISKNKELTEKQKNIEISYLKRYEEQSKNLIKYIKGEGKDKRRKKTLKEKDKIKYLEIKELDNF